MLKPATYYFFSLLCSYLYHCADQVLAVLYVSPEGERGALRSSARKRYQTEIRSFMYMYKYINSYTVYGARLNETDLGF